MASAIAKNTWLLDLFKELAVDIQVHVTMVSDSKSTIQIATNPIFYERTKYIEIDYHFIRGKINDGYVKRVYVYTKDQLIDLLTKGLSQAHLYLLGKLDVLNILHPQLERKYILWAAVT